MSQAVQRVPIGEWFSRFFGGGTFSNDELLAYLRSLDVNDRIEDAFDSDNKAREIVAQWKQGNRVYALTVRRIVLLIQEMLSGFTGDDDERAILDLLNGSRDAEVTIILNTVGEQELRDNFHTGEADELARFLEAWHTKQGEATRPTETRGEGGSRATLVRIVVDQAETQTVTIYWSDGREETDICSTGKGLCCVDPAASGGPGWSEAESRRGGSNRTPVGQFTVAKKLPATSGGVRLWTEFVDHRDIALHEYVPVDGTPLSHGCVRLNEAMAQKIYDGSVSEQEVARSRRRVRPTAVTVRGLPTPRCDHPLLQREWARDFREAGTRPPDGETSEARRERRSIARTRRTLRQALGDSEAQLTERIAGLRESTGGLPTDIFSSREARARTLTAIAPVATEIPRCASETQ